MTKLLACPHCRSPNHLRAWYLEPVAYDLVRLSPGEPVLADTAPQIGEGGSFDDYSCRNCGAVEIRDDDLVLVEAELSERATVQPCESTPRPSS